MRTRIAIAVISFLSLYSAVKLYVPRTGPRDDYGVAELRNRFQAIDSIVSPGTRLAYVSDRAPDSTTILALEYAVAPRMLVQDTVPHRFVLGNFYQSTDYAEFGRIRGLTVVREFPRGVVLYERKP